MRWSEKFSVAIEASALPGRALIDAHLASFAGDGLAGAPPQLVPTPADANAGAAWRVGLGHGELLAVFDLREREATLTTLWLGAGPSVVLLGDHGQPLAMACEPGALEDTQLRSQLRGRELLISGDAARLWALAQLLDRADVKLDALALIVDHVPLLPAAARLLQNHFGAPVGEGVRDGAGGWLAIARRQGELLESVRPADALHVSGRGGAQLADGHWGLVGTRRQNRAVASPVWARIQPSRDGARALQLGVPATPLESLERPELHVGDLHDMLGTLPVFAYFVRFELNGEHRLRISITPGLEQDPTEAAILAAIRSGTDQMEVLFAEPGVEFSGMRVFDARGIYSGRVVVVWAGAPGSEARRAGWREAVGAAAGGGRRVQLLDAKTGAPMAAEAAAEAVGALALERADLPDLLGCGDGERVLGCGDPRVAGSFEAHGWISLLPGDDEHEPLFMAGVERENVAHVHALFEAGVASPELAKVSIDGVNLQPYTRPTLARGRSRADDRRPLWVDDARCTGAGDCARVCPTQAIELRGDPLRPIIEAAACIRCQLCCERCEAEALRPLLSDDAAIVGPVLLREAELLRSARRRARPRALVGKLCEPPPRLDARRAPARVHGKPTVVLGLATVTLMEHAAALLVDGELVSAVEEERLARIRHYRWQHPERPGTSLSSDICLRLEESWPTRAIDAVLRMAGLTMDDVDLVAVNGIPARYRQSFAGGGGWRPPPVLRANSIVYVPHHMSHAASVYGLSDFEDAWILSVDGRGDYETATVWRAEGHQLEVIDAVPWQPDCSFGGVYETVTRALGMGSHGQGSTMALAAMGEASVDLSTCMSFGSDGKPVLSEWAAEKLVEPYTRGYDDPITDEHRALAASAQLALETTVGDYLAHHAGDLRGQRLALSGGVALNCRMNGVLRDRFAPADMYVAPGANDAGTAIGAAVIAHRELTGELPRLGLGHTHLGPSWSDEAIVRSLERMRVPFTRSRDVGAQAAELLAAGQILCWFQGPMEFGPRALGGRSIVADPRWQRTKDRLNMMKSRQAWRPFGPSVLAGRQGEWFVQDWDSRFMLFAVDVRPEKREQIPVVVHADGSSRPQIVHASEQPRYHAMISAFEQRTGVPMVVNTSFNRGGEAIVCNPVEAMRSFVGLGADAIVLGDCVVRREQLRRR